ncbi:MAG: DUF1667 domain-containing protein [Clostridiaceae bacterium]|jgi:CxxC motif-containing protein|nr:DUF1667 domain-containing protein [Clostridiaceae bacterium]
MRELICIVCPQGCHLKVDEDNDYQVSGHGCARGVTYGRDEVMNPLRTITSTVCVDSSRHPRCPVKSDRPIPKKILLEAVALLDQIRLTTPVHRGDIVLEGILGYPSDFVATRDILE